MGRRAAWARHASSASRLPWMSVRIAISTGSSRPTHHAGYEMFDGWCANLLHGGVKLEAHQLEHALDTRLAEGAQTPDVRTADADRASAEAERLHDVGPPAEARVDQDRHAPTNRFNDLRERVDRG